MKNEPAFPTVNYEGPGDGYGTCIMTVTGGLTKRQYFAGLAMQGIVMSGLNCEMETRFSEESVAQAAVEYADALIIELEKPNE